jgi:signal transduction histidine kinase
MFRIFQEVLTNVARHSGASEIMVRLNSEGSDYLFEIKDNGKGISESEINSPKALGIIGMKERAFLLHGKLSIVGERAIGTTVLLRFPRKLKNAEKTYLQ